MCCKGRKKALSALNYRIKNTLALEKVYISEVLLKEAEKREDLEIIGELKEMLFDSAENLLGGDYV